MRDLTPKTIEYVTTKNGVLRGFRQRGIYSFLGVEYGKSRRWRTAEPVSPWRGVKNAVQFGNITFPQKAFTPWDSCGVAHELYQYSEDCLNLNIWTPSIDSTGKKPVMVWLHGGGFSSGSAIEMQAYDGENLSRYGDVTVVTVNHRLNIFGFLDVSQFGEEYANSGNCGLSDLVLALNWIHDNIAAFGGDPDNVTIFGQSGGREKVTALLQIPAADGLFHKAIVQSGIHPYPLRGEPEIKEDSDRSRAVVELLFKKLGIDSLSGLEKLEPEELLRSYNDILPRLEAMGFKGRSWTGVAGDYYKGYPYNVGFTEHAGTIPVMVGCTLTEMPLMRVFNKHEYTDEQRKSIVREAFPGQDADRLISLFQKAWPDKVVTDAIEMSGRMEVRASVIRFADLRAGTCPAPTYVYTFAHEFPQEGGRDPWHCAELPIVFHNAAIYPESYNSGVLDGFEDAVCSSWVNFARFGDPNNDKLPVKWPRYTTGECATMILDDNFRVGFDFDRELTETRRMMELHVTDKYGSFVQLVN